MEGRRNHWNRAFALAIAATLLLVPAADAGDEAPQPIDKADRTAVVYTTPDSAVVEAEMKADEGTAKAASKRSGRSCHLQPDTAPVTATTQLYRSHPGEQSFVLYCDGQWVGLVWVPIDPGPMRTRSPADIRDEAMRLREEIPMPRVAIGVNPAGGGLVGVEAWFWIEGYRGEAITYPTSAFGIPVEVEARPTSYKWSFGDGAVIESQSLGDVYPDRSEIRHTYERSSAGYKSGYPVDIQFGFDVRYQLSGGPWIALPPITRNAQLNYPVRESQAVINR